MLFAVSPGHAALKDVAVALTSDANGDGIAGIGDTITLTCVSTTDDSVYVTSTPSLGFTQLRLQAIDTQMYSAIYTVSAGSVNQQVQFIFKAGDAVMSTNNLPNQKGES